MGVSDQHSGDALSEESIRTLAKARIAKIFRMDVVSDEQDLGDDLSSSGASDFESNEYDEVLWDLQFASGSTSLKSLQGEGKSIRTVRDYCDFMICSYRSKPGRVVKLLSMA